MIIILSKFVQNFIGTGHYLEIFRMWCMRKMEYVSCTVRVENEEVILKVKEERNILHTIKRKTAKWICHILRRNCLLKEGRI
jgi:hypothetical protein